MYDDLKLQRRRHKDAEVAAICVLFLFALTAVVLLAIVIRLWKFGLEMG